MRRLTFTMAKHKFKRAWQTPPDILQFIKIYFKGRVLNLCCGEALIGDVNVDLYPQIKSIVGDQVLHADVLADDFDLKERFDVVYCDPPFNWPYDLRAKLNNAVAKHLKPRGLFILNSPWLPKAVFFDLLDIYVVYNDGGLPSNAVMLTVAEYTGKK